MKYNKGQIATAPQGLAILNRQNVAKFTDGANKNTILIRIAGGGDEGSQFEDLPFEADYHNVRRWVFDDCTTSINSDYFPNGPINEEQAAEIAEFLHKNRNKNLVVHSEAGISRSSAVGKAWSVWLDNLQLAALIEDCGVYWPNELVYKLVLQALQRLDLQMLEQS